MCPSALCFTRNWPPQNENERNLFVFSFQTAPDPLDPHSELEGDAPDGSFANRYGRHAVGHVDDFNALQQQVLEGRSIVQRLEAALRPCLNPPSPLGATQKQNNEQVRTLFLLYNVFQLR